MNPEPPPAPASLIVPLASVVERLDVNTLFPRPQPLHVELGAGDGSFLIQYAAAHPEWNFLGVERLLGRLRKIDRKGRRAGLLNVRGVRIEAAYFLEFLLPPRSAASLHVYFPDPWPKRKHRKHRLINERFPALARAALVPGGTVLVRTDDADYFSQMLEVFQSSPYFEPLPAQAEIDVVLTDFERGFQARGISTRRAAWKMVG